MSARRPPALSGSWKRSNELRVRGYDLSGSNVSDARASVLVTQDVKAQPFQKRAIVAFIFAWSGSAIDSTITFPSSVTKSTMYVDWILTPELPPRQLAIAQLSPEQLFRLDRRVARVVT